MPAVRSRAGWIACAAALSVVWVAGCRHLPADPDGRPDGARPLELGNAAHDSMKCDEGDCADWYTIEVDQKTTVTIQLDPDAGAAWDVDVELIVYDSVGTVIDNVKTEGKPSLAVRPELAPGKYYIAVGSGTGANPVPYTLLAREEKKAAPATAPAPGKKAPAGKSAKVEVKRGSVLEISDGGRAVLLDIGKSQGIKVGQKGRLLTAGAAVAPLEIVEVYPEGSLARVSGDATAEANSTAEIDVPSK